MTQMETLEKKAELALKTANDAGRQGSIKQDSQKEAHSLAAAAESKLKAVQVSISPLNFNK